MKRSRVGLALCAGLLLGGCAQTGAPKQPPSAGVSPAKAAPTTRPDEVIARVDGVTVTMSQLRPPLMRAYGLNVLLHLVQLDLARAQAAKAGLSVSPADIRKERQWTVDQMFQGANQKMQDDLAAAVAKGQTKQADQIRQDLEQQNERLLDQFLQQQHISEPEFDLVMRTNAYLRKLATAHLPTITEENLKEAWRAQYGEKVVVRHIQLANLQEVAEAKAKLKAGESFADVAREMSRNERTRMLGGELPPFSRSATDIPEEFKRVAFDLKVGQVSDPVLAEGSYHLLKLVKRIAPKAVKFEDVKEAVRKTLIERWTTERINEIRRQLAQVALRSMTIEDPILKEEFQKRLDSRDAQIKDQAEIRRELRGKAGGTTHPAAPTAATHPAATHPTTSRAAAPATRP